MRARDCMTFFVAITISRVQIGKATGLPTGGPHRNGMSQDAQHYIMQQSQGMAETVAEVMPSAAHIAANT